MVQVAAHHGGVEMLWGRLDIILALTRQVALTSIRQGRRDAAELIRAAARHLGLHRSGRLSADRAAQDIALLLETRSHLVERPGGELAHAGPLAMHALPHRVARAHGLV